MNTRSITCKSLLVMTASLSPLQLSLGAGFSLQVIAERCADSETIAELAREYDVGEATIRRG